MGSGGGCGRAAEFRWAMRPFGPTMKGNDRAKLRAPSFRLFSGEWVGDHYSEQYHGFGKAAGFSRPIRPFGPTTNGNESAFQLPLSSGCHVRPSSRLMSEPLVPAVIQALRGTGPLGLCWRLKCSVPHPFRFFLRKGWETTKASNITASVRPLDSAVRSVHSAPPQTATRAHSNCRCRAAATYARRRGLCRNRWCRR